MQGFFIFEQLPPMRKLFILFFFCISLPVYPQSDAIEMLQSELRENREDTARSVIISRLAAAYLETDPDKALRYAEESHRLAVKSEFLYGQAFARYQKGRIFLRKKSYAEARQENAKSLELFTRINHRGGMADNHELYGLIAYTEGKHNSALEFLKLALATNEKSGDKSRMASNLSWLGELSIRLHNAEAATNYLTRAIALHDSVKAAPRKAFDHMHMGWLYLQSDELTKAAEHLEKSLELAGDQKITEAEARSSFYLGQISLYRYEPDVALQFFLRADSLFSASADHSGRAENSLYMGVAYRENGNFVLSDNALQRSLNLSKSLRDLSGQSRALIELSATAEKQGQYGQALKFFRQGISIRDSIGNDQERRTVMELQTRLREEKMKGSLNSTSERNELKDTKSRYAANLRMVIMVAGALCVLMVLALLWLLRRNTRLRKMLHLERDKQSLLIRIFTSLAARLESIGIMGQVIGKRTGEQAIASYLNKQALKSLEELHRHAGLLSVDVGSWEAMAGRMQHVAEEVALALNANLSIDLQPRTMEIPAAHQKKTYSIFAEALANLASHSASTEMIITLVWNIDGFVLTVRDNGRGFDPQAAYTGKGLAEMKELALEMGGKLSILSQAGHGATVSFNYHIIEEEFYISRA